MPPSAQQICFNRIYREIPKEILDTAFKKNTTTGLPMPTQEIIRQEVFIEQVLPDCNLLGGNVKELVLLQDYQEETNASPLSHVINQPYRIFRIPPEERDGMEIVAILNVAPPNFVGSGGYSAVHDGATLNGMASRALNSYSGGGYIDTPMAEPLGGDLIRISPASGAFLEWMVSARLAYDENFSNIDSSSIRPLSKLMVLATKSIIYTKLIVGMEREANDAGAPLNRFVGIVEEYADAAEEYNEALTQFSGAAKLDPHRLKTLLDYIV